MKAPEQNTEQGKPDGIEKGFFKRKAFNVRKLLREFSHFYVLARPGTPTIYIKETDDIYTEQTTILSEARRFGVYPGENPERAYPDILNLKKLETGHDWYFFQPWDQIIYQ